MKDYSFGDFLHELRARRGLTQFQLGALVGVSDKAVSKWENDHSRPQSRMLYRLSEILCVSVDELLSCKYHSSERKAKKGIFAMKKQLWNKAKNRLQAMYGGHVPVEIYNRFLSEQMEMENGEMIVYLDVLAKIVEEANLHGEHVRMKGGIGASFVAFVLGATEINPITAHYHCPACHRVIFDDSEKDGWDLPPQKCICGIDMLRDGHRIPFAVYRHVSHKRASFDVSVSPQFEKRVGEIIRSYFGRENVVCLTHKDQAHVMTFVPISDSVDIMGGQTLSYEDTHGKLSDCPSITVCTVEELATYRQLEEMTGTAFARIPFGRKEVLDAFANGDTDGIPEFKSAYVRNMLREVKVTSFHDLIKLAGLCHGTGVWDDNAHEWIQHGISLGDVLAYRDDVFLYLQDRMTNANITDMGFAYKIMEDTRKGIYARNGIPEETRQQLCALDVDAWFLDSITKIRYMFPKAHGLLYVKTAAILMWYRIHYPNEFYEAIREL